MPTTPELPIDQLRRVAAAVYWESEFYLRQLPTYEALVGLVNLCNSYGPELCYADVHDCIVLDGDSIDPLKVFVAAHQLDPAVWITPVEEALAEARRQSETPTRA